MGEEENDSKIKEDNKNETVLQSSEKTSIYVTSQIKVELNQKENVASENINSDYYHEFISLEDSSKNVEIPPVIQNTEYPQIPVEHLYNIVTENSSFYKERSPRFENNQELYEKIEAKYGAWENSGSKLRDNFNPLYCLLICVLLNF